MKPRIAILGFMHESNSFALGTTGRESFEILHGEQIVAAHEGASTIVAGFLEAAKAHGIDGVPLMFADALPSGPIEEATYKGLCEELLSILVSKGPWDGVLLALHGAAVAEGESDADGAFVATVRAAVGPDVPVGVTLDLHANVSDRAVDAATVTVTYQTNPHLDARIRAERCADLIIRAARGEIRPVQAIVRAPVALNILRMSTDEQPMRGLVDAAAARGDLLAASVVEGFPYADVPQMGMAAIAVAEDAQAARRAAQELAQQIWDARHGFVGECMAAKEAVAACTAGTTLLLDVGDNVGGGSTGDSVVLLREAYAQGMGPVAQTIHDPAAVRTCLAAGVGGRIRLHVGAAFDPRYGEGLAVEGEVISISDGRWTDSGPVHGGANAFNAGPTAHLVTERGDALLLTSLAAPPWSAGQYLSLGVDIASMRAIIGKGVVAPRASFAPFTDRFILVDTPGPTTAALDTLPYAHRGRVWPLDAIDEWAPPEEST